MSALEKLYSDAMGGKWLEMLETYKIDNALRTEKIPATGDTLLHMAVSNGEEDVVEKMVDWLVDEKNTVDGDGKVSQNVKKVLGAKNNEKNTPLHLAVTTGSLKMCKKIGRTCPSLIARRNKKGETPLFLAALSGNKEIFLWLHYLYVPKHESSSSGFAHCIRDDDDTILHCAIGEGNIDVAIEIVHLYKKHMKEMMRRNKDGLSPLHLLASKPSAFAIATLPELPILLHLAYLLWSVKEKNRATTFEELSPEARLWKAKEKNHVTTKEESDREECEETDLLVNFIAKISYLLLIPLSLLVLILELLRLPILLLFAEEESESGTITVETPLMIAVKNGVVEMVEKILELFPSRITDVNADGKNILLLAVEYRQIEVLRFLCEQKWLTGSLFSQEDNDGNNALHLAAVSSGKEINWFKVVKDLMPRDLLGRYNRKMETPEDIFIKNHNELKKSEGEWVAKTSEACSVVSTLVVSVAFSTRTSNVPGGYEDDNGYAILRNKPRAFKTFRDSSFVALFFSLISTICFVSIIASRSQSAHSSGYVPSIFYCGVFFMFGSIVCLWISFCAADFFMLHDDPQKLHKALPTYILLTCGVILMVVLQLPKFIRPKLSRLLRIVPGPRRKETHPIEYRETKAKKTDSNCENAKAKETDSNCQNTKAKKTVSDCQN